MTAKAAKKVASNESSNLHFTQFDAAKLSATREAWLADAKAGEAFSPEIEQAMTWIEGHMVLTDHEMAYGVFLDQEPVAMGVCELAITKPSVRGKWVKLIRLRLAPSIESAIFQNDPDGLVIALNAYVTAVLGVYHVKNEHEASTIKVYGRTQEQMRFLTMLMTKLNEKKYSAFEAKIEGRWLTLKWGKK